MLGTCIKGFGSAKPTLVVSNEDLEKVVDTSDEWIFTRTGIKERRISVNESALDLAEAACLQAMGQALPDSNESVCIDSDGKALKVLEPNDIDLIILTTITPDTIVPCEAAALKKRLKAENAVAFDLNAACTGFLYGLSVAVSMMMASNCNPSNATKMNPIKHAIVVSTERLSRLTNWQNRNTCVLFGDGAGAATLEWSDIENNVLSTYMENTDDVDNSLICLNTFDSPVPFDDNGVIWDKETFEKFLEKQEEFDIEDYSYIRSLDVCCDAANKKLREEFGFDAEKDPEEPDQWIYMNGQKVFKFASKAMERSVREAAEIAGISIDDIDLIVPHQANFRIIEYAAKRLDISLNKFQITIDHTGNSSSSCLPMALCEAAVDGKIGKDSIVCLVAFGGGLTCGASILKF